jgi:hypothetical protein
LPRHFRSAEALRAENHFLRRQPYRATRIRLAVLARCFDWRDAVVVVQPRTMIRWHRAAWRLLLANEVPGWSATDPKGLRTPIRRMAYNVEIRRWPRPESFPISSS